MLKMQALKTSLLIIRSHSYTKEKMLTKSTFKEEKGIDGLQIFHEYDVYKFKSVSWPLEKRRKYLFKLHVKRWIDISID